MLATKKTDAGVTWSTVPASSRDTHAPPGFPLPSGTVDRRFQNVLACLGPGDITPGVILWAARMARANAARLDVVQYLTAPTLSPETATQRLQEAADSAAMTVGNVEPHVHVHYGDMPAALVDEIRGHGVDLVILNASDLESRYGVSATILHRILRKTNASILLVRSAAESARQLTACLDATDTAYFAARQAMELAHAGNAALRFLYPYHLRGSDLQYTAETPQSLPELEHEYERKYADAIRKWLPASSMDPSKIEVVCREVSNWDHRSDLVAALAEDDADLVVLPMEHHRILSGYWDERLIYSVVSVTLGSLLIVK